MSGADPPAATPVSVVALGSTKGAILDALARLADVIDSRHGGDPDKSYVARLFHKGTDAILKKVGEEATEVVTPSLAAMTTSARKPPRSSWRPRTACPSAWSAKSPT